MERNQYSECPEIRCRINNKPIYALIDSGSQVTCVNAKLYEDSFSKLNWPKLPVKNCHIYGAMGKKIQRVKSQVHIPINIGNIETYGSIAST